MVVDEVDEVDILRDRKRVDLLAGEELVVVSHRAPSEWEQSCCKKKRSKYNDSGVKLKEK